MLLGPKWKFNWTLAIPLTDNRNTRSPLLIAEYSQPNLLHFAFLFKQILISNELKRGQSIFPLSLTVVCILVHLTLHCVTMRWLIETHFYQISAKFVIPSPILYCLSAQIHARIWLQAFYSGHLVHFGQKIDKFIAQRQTNTKREVIILSSTFFYANQLEFFKFSPFCKLENDIISSKYINPCTMNNFIRELHVCSWAYNATRSMDFPSRRLSFLIRYFDQMHWIIWLMLQNEKKIFWFNFANITK